MRSQVILTSPCMDLARQAHAYIRAKTGHFPGPWAPCLQEGHWQAQEAALDAAVLSGDVQATKVACRALWGLAIAYVEACDEKAV